MLQVVNILVDQIAVVHIPAVALDPKLLLDNVIELVRQHKRGVLRDLTAKAVADRAEVVEERVGQPACPFVVHAPGQFPLNGPVLSRAEVVLEVEHENTARETVPPKVPLQVAIQAIHGEVDPFSLHARSIVVDKSGLEERGHDLVAERALHDALADVDAADMPPFAAVVELKLIKAAALIVPGEQGLAGLGRIRDNAHTVALGRAFPADILTANVAGREKVAV